MSPTSDAPIRGRNGASREMSRRGFEDIAASIIEACERGERKTKIMYRSMLNLRQLNRYLEHLAERGLLTREHDRNVYTTTHTGMTYMKDYREMVKKSNEMSILRKELAKMLIIEPPGANRSVAAS